MWVVRCELCVAGYASLVPGCRFQVAGYKHKNDHTHEPVTWNLRPVTVREPTTHNAQPAVCRRLTRARAACTLSLGGHRMGVHGMEMRRYDANCILGSWADGGPTYRHAAELLDAAQKK